MTSKKDSSSAAADLQVNMPRLQQEILELAKIGQRPDRGLYRMAFTDEDWEGREWFAQRIREAGLRPKQDGAANLGTVLGEEIDEPVLLVGSHLDTVPNAGHLDGTLGVLLGFEALRRIKEAGLPLKRPLEVISFSDEEGRFGGLFGSQALAGDLHPEKIYEARDLNGISLVEAMKRHGLDAIDALDARRDPKSIYRYLELHIEQGPVLDMKHKNVGIVENITGLFKWSVRLEGVPNHAGTTPMTMRKDPFLGLSEFAGEIPRILEENGTELSRATIGKVDLLPGVANTVPGEVVFSLDVRDPNQSVLDEIAASMRKALSAIARRRDLYFDFEILSLVSPVDCDAQLIQTLEKEARELDLSYEKMPSGAAHDAQIIAKIAPIGMIFVPSKDGRSHSPAEWTSWKDIEAGANLLLRTLLKILT
ncbi:MAG: Zn-dependent hydrolase [Opitutales bacterium]|nr:Zn-dependent hydrolase [Opitutales bacterium]MCH8541538.1 Zn-dependent hydrolase [Opitutales bacterium]